MAASSSSHTRPSLAALESAAQQLLQRIAMYNTDAPHEAEARAADVPDDDITYSHDKTSSSSSSDDRSSRRAREAMALRAQRYATVLRVMDLLDTRKSQAKRADDSNDNDNDNNDNDDKHVLARARAHVAAAALTMGDDDEVETIDLSHYAATTSGHLVTLCARGDGVAGDTTRFDNYVAPHDDDGDGDEHVGDVTHALSTVTHADDDDNDKDEQSQQPLRELPSLDRVLCLDDDDDDNDTAAAAATSSAPVLCSSDDNSDGSDSDDSVVLPGLAHSSSSAACNNNDNNIHNVSSSSAAALSAAVSNDAAAQQLRCALRALTAEADDGVYAFALDALHDYDADMLGHAQRTYGYARRV